MDSRNSPPDQFNIFKTDPWRLFRIISEFVDGFETMTALGPSVSIFGSARLTPDSPYYKVGIDVAKAIAKKRICHYHRWWRRSNGSGK